MPSFLPSEAPLAPSLLMRAIAFVFLLTAATAGQTDFVNFESAHVHPIRVSPDGSLLFVVNSPDARVEVYGLADPSRPTLLRTIPVGLEPVSVAVRNRDEVWVANALSDSVSVVSVREARVVATLRVTDSPADVAFAQGRAFVTAAASDEVHVFDATSHQLLRRIPIFGKDPSALATSPSGDRIYVLAKRSGNRTFILPAALAPPPPAATNPTLPEPPETGVVASYDDPAMQALVPFSIPDEDVFAIDASTLDVVDSWSGIGTINFDLAVHPATGDLWIANTEARNLVRFEPNLKGHAVDNRVTRVRPEPPSVVQPVDLNPHIDYAVLPNLAARDTALAEPVAVVATPSGRLFVAAQDTDRIGVLDATGQVIARIELGSYPSGQPRTMEMRGPRGLALHPQARWLYVFNRLASSITVVDTQTLTVQDEQPLSFDPTPSDQKIGRRFLHDARLSGNGTFSCNACHVDGETDGIAWDLGNPGGILEPQPFQAPPFHLGLEEVHPMKGPMVTQTLRGLDQGNPLHWRGDRNNFAAFNLAFTDLMGGPGIGPLEMGLFAAWGTKIAFPPNPHQNLDRTYPASPPGESAADGRHFFETTLSATFIPGIALTCADCHTLPRGSNNAVIGAGFLIEPQQMKVPHLRNLYRKTGFAWQPGPVKAGFGFTHDGAVGTLAEVLDHARLTGWPANQKAALGAYLRAFDTGTAPIVGHQVTVDASSGARAAATLKLMADRACAGDADLIGKGTRSLLWDPDSRRFLTDVPGVPALSLDEVFAAAAAGEGRWTFTATAPGSGRRLGLDRDRDGVPDARDGLFPYGASSPGGLGPLLLTGSREPSLGTSDFTLVGSGTPPGAPGVLLLGDEAASQTTQGITVLVDLSHPSAFQVPLQADQNGLLTYTAALPPTSGLVGRTIRAQMLTLDATAPTGLAATRGLQVTLRP